MAEGYDFEKAWLAKFAASVDRIAGQEIRREVMKSSDGLSSESDRQDVIAWSQAAMGRLESLVEDAGACRGIMVDCACQYPRSSLQQAREAYHQSGSVDAAHSVLQGQFEALLRDTLGLSDDLIEEIVGRGWGAAGVREGETIIATKIPKSGNLIAYMRESDPQKKRQLYCHCPRIRDVLRTTEKISVTYCYCGAGFYKSIWEEILQEPVQVEVLKSVVAGDDTCTIRVRLPQSHA